MSISPLPHHAHGTIASGNQGAGTFTAVKDGASDTVDLTRTYASGRTISDVVTIARGPDGRVSGTVSQNGGPPAQFTATHAKTAGGHDVSILLTNSAGAQETIDASSKGGSGTLAGTTFKGSSIDQTFTVA